MEVETDKLEILCKQTYEHILTIPMGEYYSFSS